jgi:hypothetical protein
MTELTDEITAITLLFLTIFVLNLVPAFAPPTWMTLSFIGLTIPGIDAVSLALVGAAAATLGRLALAKLAHAIVRQKILSEHTRHNVDAIRHGMENRRALTFGTFLAYALSPLPSNYLFIAYGLTTLPIALLGVPFFLGRLVSYFFWITTASALGDRLDLDPLESAPYFGVYFVLSQLLLVPVIYGFTRIDWHAAFAERKFKWFRSPH